jgi:PEGA domain
MNLSRTFVATVAGFLLFGVPPAHAQRRGGGQARGNGGGYRAAVPRGPVRSFASPRTFRPHVYGPPRGFVQTRSYGSRSYSYGGPRVYANGSRGGVVVGRAAPRIIGPRVGGYASGRFYRPYYVFRPRVSLGFGLWAGFPIAYPFFFYGGYNSYYYPYRYSYGYPYPYPYAYSYPYSYPPPYGYPASGYPPPYPPAAYPAPSGSASVQQGRATTGGVSFEITPSTAEVYVDGSYVGTVGEFTPTSQPLDLTPGRHRIEIRAPEYRTQQFDVDIVAGQVIPYQGVMKR